jgi:hypothetical protein
VLYTYAPHLTLPAQGQGRRSQGCAATVIPPAPHTDQHTSTPPASHIG